HRVESHRQQRELQARAETRQVVEAGAGDLRTALGVDRTQRLAQGDVVLRLEALRGEVARGAFAAQLDGVLLTAGRHTVQDEVGQAAQQRIEREVRVVRVRLQGLD